MRLRFEQRFCAALALLLLAVVWVFIPQLAGPFDVKQPLAGIGALLLTLLFVTQHRSTPWRIPVGVVGVSLLVMLAAAAVSTGMADNPLLAVPQFLQLVTFIALTLCIFNLRDDASERWIETALVIAASGVALFALKQWLLPDWLNPGFHALGKMRVYSTLGNPNLAAFVLLAALPIAFFGARTAARPQRALSWVALLLLATALLAAQSRQALLVAGLLVPIGYAWLGSPRQRRYAIASLAIACVLIVTGLSLGLVDWSGAQGHTAKGRVLIWLSALYMLIHHPLTGVGLGHFELQHASAQAALFASGHFDAFMDNAGAVKDAHNDLLHFAATTGLAGLVSFGAFCLAAMSAAWRFEAMRVEQPGLYLAGAASIGTMLFTAVLPHAATALVFWLILGLVLRRCELPVVEWSPGWGATRTIAFLALAIIIVWSIWSYRELRAEVEEGRARRLMEQHDPWLAEQKYREALAWSRNGERLKYHATTLFLAERPAEALVELDAASRWSGDVGIPILQAEILTRLGRYDQAIAIYRRLIAAFPRMITPRFVLGQVYAARAEHALAEEQFQQVLAIEPSPFNLNMTREKIELQKAIARRWLEQRPQETR